ncbi:hypothetical protein TrLO_g14330 [Triparma laevis f. longispina]|uniref:Uncharacterized protein n=1 Tax=Triparma laevis f. longispina TaxID=1714387 RepID=A0A9W7DTI0_9STRA|nr:hypothetical protein TrLO_g14330 [Triparma laevis f. longispina]
MSGSGGLSDFYDSMGGDNINTSLHHHFLPPHPPSTPKPQSSQIGLPWWHKEIQKERQRQSHVTNSGLAHEGMSSSYNSNTSLFDNRVEETISTQRQLTLPFLVFSQRQRNGENQPTLSDATTTTISSSTSSISSSNSFGGRMYAQNRSPPTIHCEFPGRTCNNCQKDLSSKNVKVVECEYCEKVTCCWEGCGGCGRRFCRFCLTTRFDVDGDKTLCIDCDREIDDNLVDMDDDAMETDT